MEYSLNVSNLPNPKLAFSNRYCYFSYSLGFSRKYFIKLKFSTFFLSLIIVANLMNCLVFDLLEFI